MAEGVRSVLDNVSRLTIEFEKFGVDFQKIGSHLSHARGSFEESEKRFSRLGERLKTLEIEPPADLELRVLKGVDG